MSGLLCINIWWLSPQELCMWVLWASQLSHWCVECLLCLIIYSWCCQTAGSLCSLQLVFHFSPHLARLNKTVSILKASRFNHAVTPHKIMAAAGRCNQSPYETLTNFQKNTFTKWLSLLLTCKITLWDYGWDAIWLYLRYICKMWLQMLGYAWTKQFDLLTQQSPGSLSDSPRFHHGVMPVDERHACWCYMRTFDLVSGNLSATRPPPTSTDEAMRMGMALVIPTREPKIRFPRTAASLHRALQNPKPVPLWREEIRPMNTCRDRSKPLFKHTHIHIAPLTSWQ